jgi:hypothetical protein
MYLDVQLIVNRLAEELGPYIYYGHTYRTEEADGGFTIVDADDGGVTPIELAARVACDWLLNIEPDRKHWGLPVYSIDGNFYVGVRNQEALEKAALKVVRNDLVIRLAYDDDALVTAMSRFVKDNYEFITKYVAEEGVDNIIPDLGDEFRVKGAPDCLLRMIEA